VILQGAVSDTRRCRVIRIRRAVAVDLMTRVVLVRGKSHAELPGMVFLPRDRPLSPSFEFIP
jgi:hypothetical protein